MKINSWEVFDTHAVGIDVHSIDDGLYRASLTFVLDDGEELPKKQKNQKAVTILLDVALNDPVDTIKTTAAMAGQLFSRIVKTANQFGDDGNVVKTHDVEAILKSVPSKRRTKSKSGVSFY